MESFSKEGAKGFGRAEEKASKKEGRGKKEEAPQQMASEKKETKLTEAKLLDEREEARRKEEEKQLEQPESGMKLRMETWAEQKPSEKESDIDQYQRLLAARKQQQDINKLVQKEQDERYAKELEKEFIKPESLPAGQKSQEQQMKEEQDKRAMGIKDVEYRKLLKEQ